MLDPVSSPYPQPASTSAASDAADASAYEESAKSVSKETLTPGQAALHAGLNAASLVPGEGIAAEFGNAALWASEGHYGHALVDAGLAMIPGGHELGSAAGLARAAMRLGSGAEGVAKAEVEKPRNGSI